MFGGDRRILPAGLSGVAGVTCAACCVVPMLLTAGVLGGAGWVTTGRWLPAVAVVLVALAAGAWWWANRAHECDDDCSCDTQPAAEDTDAPPARSMR